MKKILLLIVFCLIPLAAVAKDVTLSWEPSPSEGVTGYNVQYSCSSDVQPFSGTEADQPSPVDVGDVLTATVTGLPDEAGCYFAVTAYNLVKQESVYSNVVYSPGFAPPDAPLSLGGTTTVNNVDVPISTPEI